MKKAVLVFVLVLSGCDGSLSYSFKENDCDTGTHEADSLKGYCENLTNHALNHYCAEYLRKRDFDQQCGGEGVTWNSYVSADLKPQTEMPEEAVPFSNQ